VSSIRDAHPTVAANSPRADRRMLSVATHSLPRSRILYSENQLGAGSPKAFGALPMKIVPGGPMQTLGPQVSYELDHWIDGSMMRCQRERIIRWYRPARHPVGEFECPRVSAKTNITDAVEILTATKRRVGGAVAAAFIALCLSACVSQSSYDALEQENEKLRIRNQQLVAQVMALEQEATFVEAGDLLFPLGGFQLSEAGEAELHNKILPQLKALQNAKIVVYGYTDNTPVGPPLQHQGINDNLTLSTRRAVAVASYLVSQGIDRNIISAKGFGDTHPLAPNDTPANRARNRRIVITIQGPGAPSAEGRVLGSSVVTVHRWGAVSEDFFLRSPKACQKYIAGAVVEGSSAGGGDKTRLAPCTVVG
jgi:chemotaxis protein MotB